MDGRLTVGRETDVDGRLTVIFPAGLLTLPLDWLADVEYTADGFGRLELEPELEGLLVLEEDGRYAEGLLAFDVDGLYADCLLPRPPRA